MAQSTKLSGLSNHALVEKGRAFIKEGSHCDSAAMCLSIVIRRYYADPADKDIHPEAARAMQNLGTLYSSRIYDYEKAYRYLSSGIALAEDDNLTDLLPYLYNSMAALWHNNYLATGDPNSDQKAKEYLQRGFEIATEADDYDGQLLILANLLDDQLGDSVYADQLAKIRRQPNLQLEPPSRFTLYEFEAKEAVRAGDWDRAKAIMEKASKEGVKNTAALP